MECICLNSCTGILLFSDMDLTLFLLFQLIRYFVVYFQVVVVEVPNAQLCQPILLTRFDFAVSIWLQFLYVAMDRIKS